MLKDLDLPSLQDRRKMIRLTFFYKVVEGLVPAFTCHDYLTPIKSRRRIKAKHNSDFIEKNIIDNQVTNNSKCFKQVQCKTELYKHSFFPKTIIDWNHLEDSIVCASTKESFRTALPSRT